MKFILLSFWVAASISSDSIDQDCPKTRHYLKDGVKTELVTVCQDDMGYRLEAEYQNGVQNGRETYYFLNGKVRAISHYRNGAEEDSTMVWDSLGNLRGKRYYHRGNLIGVRKSWGESGQLTALTTYDSLGQKHGLDAEWWPDGKKKSESHYALGVCTLAVEYYRNGVKSEAYRYLNEPHTEPKPHITLSGESWSWSGKSIAKIRNGNGMAIRLPRSMDSLSHPDNGGVMLIYKDSINQKIIPLDSVKMMKYK